MAASTATEPAAPAVARTLPQLDEPGGYFWTAGARGELRVGWCDACAQHLHPSLELCPGCQSVAGSTAVSGAATVVAHTVNHQRWLAGHPPPYVVAIVALAEDPELRLTTNVVDCAPDAVHVGMAVRIRFERCDDVWVPLFAPDPARAPARPPAIEPPRIAVRRPASAERFEQRVALSGIGRSVFGRRLERGSLALTVDACRAAIDDAGLTPDRIDGICAYPGSDGLPGVSRGGVRALEQALRLHPTWHCGAQEVPGQTGAIVSAMLAVAAGLCRHVLCVSTVAQAARPGADTPRGGGAAPERIAGELAWRVPYGAATPATWIALHASHYLHRYGADRTTLGWIALNARRHAARNADALYADPLTMDEYLAGRPIATPFGLYDCDVPCDGSIALIVSDAEAARDLRQPPVRVEAVGTQIAEPQSWDQGTLTHQPNVLGPAAQLWSRTDLRPRDVDLATLYDGFSFNVVSWLEGLGFCGMGETPAFVEGGERIGPGGELPLNPHGGQLAAGRSNGYGNVAEAIVQLRGAAGARQVAGAEVAAVSSGGGIPAGCMLLAVDR